jgi:hypothetical protein
LDFRKYFVVLEDSLRTISEKTKYGVIISR